MRWDSLFEDLEAQFSAERALDAETEITERARVEVAGIEIGDRLRASVGAGIRLGLVDGRIIRGVLMRAGSGWLAISESAREWLIPQASVVTYQGLGRSVLSPMAARRSPGLASVLRALARDRAEVIVLVDDRSGAGGTVQGVIDRVGRDHFDLAVVMYGEVRRVGNVSTVMTIPIAALVAVGSAMGPSLPQGGYPA